MLNWFEIDKIILNALTEDMIYGDITTDNVFDDQDYSIAKLIAKEDGVIAGIDVARRVFKTLDHDIQFDEQKKDGDKVLKGEDIILLKGKTKSLLKAERVALNFLQRLSGIATITAKFTEQVKDFETKIVDTRKTTPGLRMLEKYAVTQGGGYNHRFSLSDAVMLKDNHIKAAGGIKNAVNLVRNKISHTTKIEIETESIQHVKEALEARVDIIMLDNMTVEKMTEAVILINKKAIVEASGNISIENVRDVAKTGVDVISVGAITHSVKSLDISMRI